MNTADRKAALRRIWRKRSWRRHLTSNGVRCYIVQRGVGHFAVPLTELTDQDIAFALPFTREQTRGIRNLVRGARACVSN